MEEKSVENLIKKMSVAKPGSPPVELPPTLEAELGKKNLIFFNVMPKIKSDNEIVQPTVSISQPSENENNTTTETEESHSTVSKLKKFKIYIILAALLLIGGPLVYFLVNKFGAGSGGKSSIIINESAIKDLANKKPAENEDGFTITTPNEWQLKYFNNETCQSLSLCGDQADPDLDGLKNIEEHEFQTDPNNNDSDQDGLADGDEIFVFLTNALNPKTANDPTYNDLDYVKGAYDISTGSKLSEKQLLEISSKMAEKGLHPPTLSNVGDVLISIYGFENTQTETVAPKTENTENTDPSTGTLEEKQDRDAQRSTTVKNVGIALIKYKEDYDQFPPGKNIEEIYDKLKPYSKVPINPKDPLNIEPFVYTYEINANADDFILTFRSEIANEVIRKRSEDSRKDLLIQEAAVLDDQRKNDLKNLQTALLLYSGNNIAGEQNYVFPKEDKYKIDLVPKYIPAIPKDPKTKLDYEYKVSETFDTFTLKVVLDNPNPGTTGYMCNQEDCREY